MQIDDKTLSYRTIAGEISRAKDQLLSVEQYGLKVCSDYRLAKVAQVYKIYQKRLKDAGAMDFDDLLVNTIKLLKIVRTFLRNIKRSLDIYWLTSIKILIMPNMC